MQLHKVTYQDQTACFQFEMANGARYWVSYECYLSLGRHQGDELSEQELAQIVEEDERLRARILAERYALYQPRTCAQVRDKLRRARLSEGIIETTLSWLIARGLLDDSSYALRYAMEKGRSKDWSQKKIRAMLYQKGLSSEDINRALDQLSPEDEERRLARTWQKKYGKRDLRDPKTFDRTYAALLRQGFPSAMIRSELNKRRKDQEAGEQDG